MGRFIVQVQGRYALWSEVVDAPITPFVASLERLAEVLPREVVVLWLKTHRFYSWPEVAHNRAGEHESCLATPEALLAAYPDEPEPAPLPADTEPAERLYGVVRGLGILPPAWGPWDSLSHEMHGDLARAAARLFPSPEPAPEPLPLVCRHRWQLVDYDRLSFKLTIFCSKCGDWKRGYCV